jgi:tetratricopeptide (TPR) repeat protein
MAAQRAIELVPDDPSAATAMITALAVNDRTDDAKARAKACIERFDGDATSLSRLAGALSRDPLNYHDLAVLAAKEAYDVDPESPAETLSLIRILAGAEKIDDAMNYARKAMTAFADDPQTLSQLASALARPELEGRCGALALEAIDAALTAEPDEAYHVQTKFRILALCQKDMEAAKATGQYAVEKAGDDPGFLNNFAWSLLTDEGLTGQFNALALEAAQRCHQQTEGGNWMYLDTLALAQFETGAKKEALDTQIKAIALAKEKGVAGASLKELEERLERFKTNQTK